MPSASVQRRLVLTLSLLARSLRRLGRRQERQGALCVFCSHFATLQERLADPVHPSSTGNQPDMFVPLALFLARPSPSLTLPPPLLLPLARSDGALVGGASLKPEFVDIIRAAEESFKAKSKL